MAKKSISKWQFGDFQTPQNLARKIVKTLKLHHQIKPQLIIEPTCGKGTFIHAALNEFKDSRIVGIDINQQYIEEAKASISQNPNSKTVTLKVADFFSTNWTNIISNESGYILILGNPPWVTSSQLSILNSENIPSKSNFQNRRGIESITGSANFDISEWMLLQYIKWLSDKEGTIAVLCKYSVARKVLRQVDSISSKKFSSSIYLVDAKANFGASVEACLFVLSTNTSNTDCKVYQSLDSYTISNKIGERDGLVLSNIVTYEKWKHLKGQDPNYLWRSGIKHDCARVMELERVSASLLLNGLGEKYDLEETYLYPLLKSSDIGNQRTQKYRKLILVPQKAVGEDTSIIQVLAPQTWQYLLDHDELLAKRKSSIYKNKPPYSIFGIGNYTFKNCKIAISGLYKKLNFCVVSPLDNKAVVFDDTVNFLSFDTEEEAKFIFSLITSKPALELLESMIFWDEKRPITIEILKRLSLEAVAQELGVLAEYSYWTEVSQLNQAKPKNKDFSYKQLQLNYSGSQMC
jgi:methylase of polypeptide subunit release factors